MDTSSEETHAGRWAQVDNLLTREGPFSVEGFAPGKELATFVHDLRLLVIGAGGLGCELLKTLTLMGFKNIDVIDMDTIDVSNLNRQFLFRASDVGKPKATVAAAFINGRVPGANVVGHHARIESFDASFYSQFNIVVAGLDSLAARRWLNSMLASLCEVDEDGSVLRTVALIDGGTEAFKGHVRVVIPQITPCFECTLDAFPEQTTFPMCTITNTPRRPEHCISYAMQVQWPRERAGEAMDGDNAEHIEWLFHKATERAETFGIEGITMRLTKGVAKNVIPAIASTNAMVAAACANEVFKLASNCCTYLNNFTFYNGTEGTFSHSYAAERNEDCLVCGIKGVTLTLSPDATLRTLVDMLESTEHTNLTAPTITLAADGEWLYTPNKTFAAEYAGKLPQRLADLGVAHGTEIVVTAKNVANAVRAVLKLE